MARNASGTYTLASGNPVTSGDAISSTWANDTLSDLETEMTASLDRNGKGGMLAVLKGVDGAISGPAYAWSSEANSGFYRAGAGDVRISILGVDIARFHASNGLELWNGASWDTVEITTGGLDNVVEDTLPQLGGALDVNGNAIVSASAGDIAITPDTTGNIILSAQKWPQADGTVNQIISTNGSGQLAWSSTATHTELTVTSSITFSGATVANGGTVTTIDINGGTVDGTNVGATTPGTGAFTTLEAAGALTAGAEIVEAVGTVGAGATPELDPADGTVQTWTLTIESTPTEVMATGEYITLLISTPSYNVIWTHVDVWVGGSAPTLDTTNTNVIELWKVGSTVYGAYVGAAS